MGHTGPKQNFIMIDRGNYWQCGYSIDKGSFDAIRHSGLEKFLLHLAEVAPFQDDRLQEIVEWDQVKLLSIRIDRLDRWAKPGVLCIGDAAHAMSPIGGVGVNLAIQDAVAAANALIRRRPHAPAAEAGEVVDGCEAGQSAGIVLDRQVDISRGDWIATPGSMPCPIASPRNAIPRITTQVPTIPHTRAITFFVAPPISQPITSLLVYGRK